MSDQQVKLKMNSANDIYLALGVDTGTTEDADNRFELQANGKISLGNGTDAPDVVLERSAAGVLSLTTGSLVIPSGTLLAPLKVVNTTASTLTLTAAEHSNALVTVDRAAGCALTLPAATGSGAIFRILIGTTVTSNSTTVKVVGNDTMVGGQIVYQDGGGTLAGFEASGTDDTITFNGSTTGGIKGDYIELIDAAADLWFVRVTSSGTGTEATCFSATV